MVEVDNTEGEYKQIVLSTVAHETSILTFEHVRKVVHGKASSLKHFNNSKAKTKQKIERQ
jgi:hypothetical protein